MYCAVFQNESRDEEDSDDQSEEYVPSEDDDSAGFDDDEDSDEDYTSISENSDSGKKALLCLAGLLSVHCVFILRFISADFEEDIEDESDEESGKDWDELEEEAAKGWWTSMEGKPDTFVIWWLSC